MSEENVFDHKEENLISSRSINNCSFCVCNKIGEELIEINFKNQFTLLPLDLKEKLVQIVLEEITESPKIDKSNINIIL
jgi:hypothetical protein